VKDDLADIMIRLDSNDETAMADLYGSTASHLYGIIYRVTGDAVLSGDALKRVYTSIWRRRHDVRVSGIGLLEHLRALAHRYALEGCYAGTDDRLATTRFAYGKVEDVAGTRLHDLRDAYRGDGDKTFVELDDILVRIGKEAT